MKSAIISLLFTFWFSLAAIAQPIDSLLTMYASDTQSIRLSAANTLCRVLYEQEYTDSLFIFTPRTDPQYIEAQVYSGLSLYYVSTYDYSNALSTALYGAEAANRVGDQQAAANCYSVLCVVYQRLGDFTQALDYANRCYLIDKENNDIANLSHSLHNLATLSLYNKQIDQARDYIDRAIEYERPLGNRKILAVRYGLASEIYMAMGDYYQAVDFALQAYSIDYADGRTDKAAVRLCQMGAIYQAQGDNVRALDYYSRAVRPLTIAKNYTSLAICQHAIGSIVAQKGNLQLAKESFLQAIAAAQLVGSNVQRQKSYIALAQLLQHTAPQESIGYYQKAAALRDSLFTIESQQQISNFNVQYQTQEKELQIEMQHTALQQERLVQRLLWVSVGLLVLLLIMTIRLLLLQRNRTRELQQVNALKDKFFFILSHDLKNPVQAQNKLLEIMARNCCRLSPNDLEQQCRQLYQSSGALLELVLHLLDWSRLEVGRMTVKPVRFDLKAVADDIIRVLRPQVDAKQLSVEVDVPQDAYAYGDLYMYTTVCHNVLQNAIKFTPIGGHICMKALRAENSWCVSVQDNGVGMDKDQLASLWSITGGHTSIGTAGEQGTGLGMSISKEMVEKNGGKIWAESAAGRGTTVYFTITFAK